MLRSVGIALFWLVLPGGLAAQAAAGVTLDRVWTMDGTYRDSQNGVTFRYPSAWQTKTQFGYHPPALYSSGAKPITGFGYSFDSMPGLVGPYAHTNLEGFGIVYAALPAADAADCGRMAASIAADDPAHPPAPAHGVVHSRSFFVFETAEAGMSQSNRGKLYATHAGNTCYLFETSVATAALDDQDGIHPLTGDQLRRIDAGLAEVIQSIRIESHAR